MAVSNIWLEGVQKDFPEYKFRRGRRFSWRAPRTITVMDLNTYSNEQKMQCLHELGHALLMHTGHRTDVERVVMEREAWTKAEGLAKRYGVEFDTEAMEAELDSYRNWLHQRSECPKCGLTRYQTKDGKYHCARCESLV